jgi:hypothetical protein
MSRVTGADLPASNARGDESFPVLPFFRILGEKVPPFSAIRNMTEAFAGARFAA